ncbi:rhodanese-like domain-containing protein [Microlunatus antarcticus]|jgi:rhodanese-related sulfurtransferase|uniref:Rhodanese-related sulfurtransferase n=1 Tax=Microlunatus antarcticus TaxID=53388 RepID=A0A7W5JVI2_9ACTN|nr:rhodanese-like domain-containing protein [Microlunatus antarcticus]MBB3327018.1 rhodanese-related sulfurtransferase [Microlunatus antarcticus]
MSREADLDPQDAFDLLRRGEIRMLDVREPHEWANGHPEGADHLPLGDVTADAVPDDRPVLTVCRSGRRSGQAADRLSSTHEVRNVAGGLTAWAEQGLPLVDDAGQPGTLG